MRVIVDILAIVGAWFAGTVTILGGWVVALNYWRKRAAKSTRPGASKHQSGGRTLGLVSNSAQPGASPRHSSGTPNNPAGQS